MSADGFNSVRLLFVKNVTSTKFLLTSTKHILVLKIHRIQQNLYIYFLFNRQPNNVKNHWRMHRKY
jgi:hypothetical protein